MSARPGAKAMTIEELRRRLEEETGVRRRAEAALSALQAEVLQLRSARDEELAERLAAVGQVAAGVAHEINNPLTYVLANLELALRELPPAPSELREALQEAQQGAERVRDIVRELRLFTGSDGDGGGACDVGEVLRSALVVVRNDLRHRAELVVDATPAPPAALSSTRLSQALVAVLSHAARAIPAGHAASNRITVRLRGAGGEVQLAVSDTGAPLSDDERAHLFEPFHQGSGREPGLGLAVAHAIVTGAGGRITAERDPHGGSTLRLSLPCAPGAGVRDAAPAPRAAAGAVRPRVLVIDDEPLVARAVARLLRDCQVEVVSRGDEALRLLGGEAYDAVLCDLMMPEMSGMELHARVAERDPELASRFVFLTGGAFTDAARRFVARPDVQVVDKPVDPDALRAAVTAARARPRG